ncbi:MULTISPECIES: hypothetical protein [unclassified Variovorax]|uniref:hypothetical protein n=1 Tax=unclassified Variovorax TaxID=663243 RepID=UPI0008C8D528|nr:MULTISPECIES: hypothetical protein [unclassified Variovorax]SEK16988.1 hypothetical protein SAMN05518853_13350 [Variovorax sp. OK202]SFE66727.1 hypothetical protein SAMN05444746_13250 [Variovorax sp. OK212]
MRERWLRSGRRARGAAAALLLAPALCLAESAYGSASASARLQITVVVPPVFRVLEVTPVADGYEYRVWTNMPSIVIGGHEYRFERIGENTVRVPTAPGDTWVVHGL